MKVGKLKQILEEYDDDMEVHIAYDYGDHWHTQVTPEINNIDVVEVKYSDYHQMYKISNDDEGEKEVIILS